LSQIAANGTDNKGAPEPRNTLISGAYSNWPTFPSEHVDVDHPEAAIGSSTAGTLFNVDATTIGVYAFPSAIRMSAGRAQPFACTTPG